MRGGDEIKKKGKDKKLRVALEEPEGTADCTAEEAAAWYFEYCSRERMAKTGRRQSCKA